MGSMGAILRAKYLAQVRFEVEAPVYTEADLRKRASESKQLDYRAESSAPSVQQGGESGSSNTTKNTSDLEKRTSGTRQPDNRAGSLALPIKIEEDEGPAGVPTRSESLPHRPNSVPPRPSSSSTDHARFATGGNARPIKKRKSDREMEQIPTGPRPWSYFDNYRRLPPTTAHAPRNVPRPSTGHWASRQMGHSQAMFDSPY
jgi:hypothetical protein